MYLYTYVYVLCIYASCCGSWFKVLDPSYVDKLLHMWVKGLNSKMIIAAMFLLEKKIMKTKIVHNNQYDYQWGNEYVN